MGLSKYLDLLISELSVSTCRSSKVKQYRAMTEDQGNHGSLSRVKNTLRVLVKGSLLVSYDTN